MTGVVKVYLAVAAIEIVGVLLAAWWFLTQRHTTHTPAVIYDQDSDPTHFDELADWERTIRTPGLLEHCIAEELGA